MSHAVEIVWNALLLILSGGFLLLMLIGFWRGMSVKPRPARVSVPEPWWNWSGW